MLELAFLVLCILGLCKVISIYPVCIVGIVYVVYRVISDVVRKLRQ